MPDHETVQRELNHEVAILAGRRHRALDEADALSRRIGALATYLREELNQSKAETARVAGLSPSHMTEWMRDADRDGLSIADEDPLRRVTILHGEEIRDLVSRHGGPARVVASAGHGDTMFMAGLDPEQLLRHEELILPNMLIQATDGEWVGVENVNVGMGRTGPDNAIRALLSVGVDEQTAYDIAWRLASDVYLEPVGTDQVTSSKASVLGLHIPRRIGRSWVVPFAAEEAICPTVKLGRQTPRRIPLHEGDPLPLNRWLAYLAQPRMALPMWLRGSLRARVYLDRQVARADGFSQQTLAPNSYTHEVYPVIFEQGRLQLWVTVPFSDDPTIFLADETYEILDKAGFITDELRARDSQSTLRRIVRAATTGHIRPDRIEFNSSGLRFEPSPNLQRANLQRGDVGVPH